MDKILESVPLALSHNLIQLRKSRGLSQNQLALQAGIPRSTITYMESGDSNPSLSNLLKVSSALQVSLEELLTPQRSSIKVIRANDVPRQLRYKNKVLVKKLLPDSIAGMEIDHMTLESSSRMKGTPHLPQTKEYLYCSSGQIKIYIDRKNYVLNSGDVIAFPGDLPHAYENPSNSKKAICFSVVVFAQEPV